jgi:hypothetical protein
MSKTYDWLATEPDPSLPVTPGPDDDGPPPIEPDDLGPQCQKAPDFAATQAAKEPKEPYTWKLRDAAEVWTADPAKLRALSDPAITQGLLREREMVQIVGAAKLAKSWLAVAWGLAVSTGTPFLGFPTSQRKVLFLDFELKEAMFAKRLSMLAPVCPSGFHFQCLRGKKQPLPEDVAELVRREGFGLCFIDSLYVTGWLTDENDNNTTSRELRELQTAFADLGCSLVVVDHTAKGGGAERSAVDSSRGASSKGGIFDAVIVLRPSDKGEDEDARYAVLDPELRDWARFKELPLIAFRWTETTCEIVVEGTVAKGATEAASAKVLGALAESGTVTKAADIQATTKLSKTATHEALKELVAKKRVEEQADPNHKTRRLYILREPSQSVPNRPR